MKTLPKSTHSSADSFAHKRPMHESFTELLHEKQLKITPQRLAILELIYENGHVGVEEIYQHIKQIQPNISLATVYKNVATLSERDILREVKPPTQKQKYELASDKHIHVSCERCGKLQDVHVDVGELLGACMSKTGYALFDLSAVFIGVCAECQQASDSPHSQAHIAHAQSHYSRQAAQ